MISKLEVKNFKSIKHLILNCKKKNIFIGEPNTGKSNILESLGLLSSSYHGRIDNFVRLENMTNLFYDEDLESKIEVSFDQDLLEITFKDGNFIGRYIGGKGEIQIFNVDYGGSGRSQKEGIFRRFKFYRHKIRTEFGNQTADFLHPPQGDNLLAILMSFKQLKKLVAQIFKRYGFKIVLKPQESKIEVQKEVEDVVISYPYSLVSDTLQSIVFHLAAIETNKNSVIIFEEPEAHAFPFYTKYLGERIALSHENQFFITTHNPYFLESIIEKTPKEDLAIFITYFEDYQTKVKALSQKELEELMEGDIFLGIESFLETEDIEKSLG